MNMHGFTLLLIPVSFPPLPLRKPLKSSIPTYRYCHDIDFRHHLIAPSPPILGNFRWDIKNINIKKNKKTTLLRATHKESPYEVLGVSPSATPQQIKQAYRKLALKFHPDVNKEANAQEKFMRIKHAYNTLVNSESQRKYDFRNQTSDYSNSTSRNAQDEEEFYGFEDFFRDLQKEFQNWEASADSQGKPKSLWEELADIGEEFVEFLEKELNITDSNEVDNSNDGTMKGNTYEKRSWSGKSADDTQNGAGEESSIEENIDEIEAALAQLKKELGL
ncbi:chaperone DnaJ-domain superfamily protein isoform X2 [Tasmannia lanceolata]|uniref:chaperone DnaJ-domain superfamily protein isoform X2 n=1 Tax=Tasmannia lanceolata TaxID=3420 RepID=UPI0040628943